MSVSAHLGERRVSRGIGIGIGVASMVASGMMAGREENFLVGTPLEITLRALANRQGLIHAAASEVPGLRGVVAPRGRERCEAVRRADDVDRYSRTRAPAKSAADRFCVTCREPRGG